MAGKSKLYLAHVQVTPNQIINDPQGKAISLALNRSGFQSVTSVRAGKYFEIVMEAQNEDAAKQSVKEMCSEILANPVIETFSFTVDMIQKGTA